ncbi:Non-specific serine/threonine protein kinase [Sulfidibacter corallicola]|uniref:Serine/threonine protein kinase n=1 Tax=Sulfidibacter corallicola TaxID=2818388 RepID=A0A8A4TJN3_SULCO|nr:serine/threonine-protein kinase [Sulfidibacter corallicola]QTD50136.1 serine/threonine protein kinase [Sulfidibacter corallicola]
MDPHLWQKVERIFGEAGELPFEQRAAYLDEACEGDASLRAEVESLLAIGEAELAVFRKPLFDCSLKPGQRLGRYEIVRKLGQGGMGTVYLAEQVEGVRRWVAIKFIGSLAFDEERKKRFEVEQLLLARMSHSYIAKLYETGMTEEGFPYFVMEFIEGLSITEFCDQHQLTITERLELFIKVCGAIAHAHLKGIIHRDIKPSNILVIMENQVPTPKVIDFGIAKTLDGSSLTRHDTPPGTLRYMSPEQAGLTDPAGNRLDPDFRSDIYTLGLLLYELLVGVPPLMLRDDSPVLDARRQICLEAPKKPSHRWMRLDEETKNTLVRYRGDIHASTLFQNLRGDLDWIVLKALEKQPDRRYQSAHEFKKDLLRHLTCLPIEAGPPSPLYVLGKFVRRHRMPVIAVFSVFLLTVGFTVSLVFAHRNSLRERDRAQRERDSARQITNLMIDMFEANDPYQERTGDITVKQVLDRASKKINDELKDQPETKIQMMLALGQVYHHLGHYDQSVDLLDACLRLTRARHGRMGLPQAERSRKLAKVLMARGDYPRAERLMKEVLAYQRESLGVGHPETALTMAGLGNLWVSTGAVDQAEEMLRGAVEIQRAANVGSLELSDTLNTLGMLLRRQGEMERAVPLFEESLQLQREGLGEDHPNVATATNNLAAIYHGVGDFTRAAPLYRRSLELKRKRFGDSHPTIANGLNNLAVLLQDMGEDEEAERMLREAVEIRRRHNDGPTAPLAKNLINLGRQVNINGDHVEAEVILKEAIAMFVALFGPGHPEQAGALNNLGIVYRKMKRLDDAQQAHQKAWDIFAAELGPDHFKVGVSMMGLAHVANDRESYLEAESLCRQATAILERRFPDGHWIVDKARALLGRSLTGQKRYEEAEVLLRQAYQSLRQRFGDDDGFVTMPLKDLILLYEQWGKPEKARRYRERLEVRG